VLAEVRHIPAQGVVAQNFRLKWAGMKASFASGKRADWSEVLAMAPGKLEVETLDGC
jgi:hypothetical protein